MPAVPTLKKNIFHHFSQILYLRFFQKNLLLQTDQLVLSDQLQDQLQIIGLIVFGSLFFSLTASLIAAKSATAGIPV